jgi:hypothetical protein
MRQGKRWINIEKAHIIPERIAHDKDSNVLVEGLLDNAFIRFTFDCLSCGYFYRLTVEFLLSGKFDIPEAGREMCNLFFFFEYFNIFRSRTKEPYKLFFRDSKDRRVSFQIHLRAPLNRFEALDCDIFLVCKAQSN